MRNIFGMRLQVDEKLKNIEQVYKSFMSLIFKVKSSERHSFYNCSKTPEVRNRHLWDAYVSWQVTFDRRTSAEIADVSFKVKCLKFYCFR